MFSNWPKTRRTASAVNARPQTATNTVTRKANTSSLHLSNIRDFLATKLSSSDKFIFQGLDGTEAEDFIFAVRQKAQTEGKSEDNDWLVEYASNSMARGALRWHATLDDKTQKDWKKLQAAILARYRPVFRGIDGVECEDFLAEIRSRIIDEGREGDNVWIASIITTSFVGDALRWYLTLDPSMRNDWEKLQLEMMEKYPAPEERDYTLSYGAPIPAALPDLVSAFSGVKKGRIKVEAITASASGYISRTPSSDGYVLSTSLQSDALIVEFKAGSEPFVMDATNFSNPTWKYLGMSCSTQVPDMSVTASSTNYVAIVGVDKAANGTLTASWKNYTSGPTLDAMWVIQADNTLIPTWLHAGTKNSLSPFIYTTSRSLFASPAGSTYYDTNVTYTRAKFIFEPM